MLDLLKEIKNNHVSYAIMNQNGEVYCNKETNNIMDIFGIEHEGEHIYGIYGDVVNGQIDSRNTSDEEIEKVIDYMLSLGEPIKRVDLPADKDFKSTYLFEKTNLGWY